MSTKPEPARKSATGIHQTPFGRFLCWLGVHALITQHVADERHPSAWGGCVRCNRGFQWD